MIPKEASEKSLFLASIEEGFLPSLDITLHYFFCNLFKRTRSYSRMTSGRGSGSQKLAMNPIA